MEFRIERESFLNLLKRVVGICCGKSTLFGSQNCLIEAYKGMVSISATDLSLSIKTDAMTNVREEGKVVVNARRLFDTVRSRNVGTDITLGTDSSGKHVCLMCEHFRSTLMMADCVNFPPLDIEQELKNAISLNGFILKDALKKVLFSASKDESRPDFTGISIKTQKDNKLHFITTDGHRLSHANVEVELSEEQESSFSEGVVIPASSAKEIISLLSDENVKLAINEKKLILQSDDFIVKSNVLAASFPDFTKVIPQNAPIKTIVKKEELRNIVNGAQLYSMKTCIIIFCIEDGKLFVSAVNENSEEMKDHILCDNAYTLKESIRFGVCYTYVLDVLSVLQCDEISIEVIDPDSPILIKDTTTDAQEFIIMPMQI